MACFFDRIEVGQSTRIDDVLVHHRVIVLNVPTAGEGIADEIDRALTGGLLKKGQGDALAFG